MRYTRVYNTTMLYTYLGSEYRRCMTSAFVFLMLRLSNAHIIEPQVLIMCVGAHSCQECTVEFLVHWVHGMLKQHTLCIM